MVRRVATMLSRPVTVTHEVADARWALPDLTIAVLSDLHVCRPWSSLAALGRTVAEVNALGADMILLPGDFIADRNLPAVREPAHLVIEALTTLRARLGVFAVMGNHDWWDCQLSRDTDFTRNSVRDALEASGIGLLDNRAVRVRHGTGFWLVGFDSQDGVKHLKRPGFHRPDAAFCAVTDGAPAILMAHEPDYFAKGDARAFLQVSGHTHGGQANLMGWRPMTPSRFGGRYAYGHIQEGGRHLVVSGGIGFSGLPLRLFQPPEITVIRLTSASR
jgi:uncharacterized protein